MNPLFIGPIFELGTKLIERLIPDKEAQAKAQLELITMQQKGDLDAMQTQLSAILAEAASADPYTSRARPSFLYVMYLLLISAIPFGILWAFEPNLAERMASGFGKWLDAIPEPLYALFGAGYLGYTAFRSWDKRGPGTK